MTQQPASVESPFAHRHVQWTLGTMVLGGLLGMLATLHPPSSGELGPSDRRGGIQIELNRAAAGELSLLPGVGPVLAGRIVADRQRQGEFGSIEDLLRVHGIGPKTLEQIAAFCVIDPPSPAPPPSMATSTDAPPGSASTGFLPQAVTWEDTLLSP